MVVIFSSSANSSKQIQREVQRAFEREVPVVPFRIENVAPEKSLAYYMGPVHWLDALTPPLEQHLQKLVVSLKPFAQINVLGEKDNEERSPRDAEADKSAEIDRLRPADLAACAADLMRDWRCLDRLSRYLVRIYALEAGFIKTAARAVIIATNTPH
jgi:hypothetical protein